MAPSPGLAVLGCYFTASAVPMLVELAFTFRLAGAAEYESNRDLFWAERWASVAGASVKAVLGVGLFVGTRGASELWRKLQA